MASKRSGEQVYESQGASVISKIKQMVRLLKALTTDERVPKPIRWLIGVSLAIKAVPLPDFGVDEVALLVAFVLLSTVYRRRFSEIREEIRMQDTTAQPAG